MNHDIRTEGLKVGGKIDTRGVYYAPYNKLTCIAITDNAIVGLVSGHPQYWGQRTHYINAHVIVWKKIGPGHDGDKFWTVESVWDQDTGHSSKQIQREGIAFAQALAALPERLR